MRMMFQICFEEININIEHFLKDDRFSFDCVEILYDHCIYVCVCMHIYIYIYISGVQEKSSLI